MVLNNRSCVLFIDDDPDILWALEHLATQEGYQVITASDGKVALSSAQLDQVDAIFTDIEMRPMNGIHFLQELRRLGHETPVVFITGHATPQNLKSALQLGAVDFIEKPFQFNTVRNVAYRVIEMGIRQKESQRISQNAAPRELTGSEFKSLKRHRRVLELLRIQNHRKRSAG